VPSQSSVYMCPLSECITGDLRHGVTRFGTMGTELAGLEEKDRGHTMSQPTWPKDPGQEAHDRGNLKRRAIDKSCK
jgi:hypothetical protein